MSSPLQNDKTLHQLLHSMTLTRSEAALSKGWNKVMARRSEIGQIPTSLWLVADPTAVKGFVDACPSIRIKDGTVMVAVSELDNILDYIMEGINLAFANRASFTKPELDKIRSYVVANYAVYARLVSGLLLQLGVAA